MDPNKALKFAILAGEIMLSNGAETFRVEDTMLRILQNCNFDDADSFVATTGLFASIKNDSDTFTTVKRVYSRTNNLERIALTNDVSRSFAEGKITVDEGIEKLKQIKIKSSYSIKMTIFVSGIASFSFTYLFGGKMTDCLNAFITGLIVQCFISLLQKHKVSNVIINILAGGTIALIGLIILNLGLGDNIDNIIIGTIMPLVPGLALTNGIRDILYGDYLSGTSRLADALIIAVSIATGIGTVLKIWIYLFGGIFV